MTTRGGPLLHKPGGDNTLQRKLARGCGHILAWVGFTFIAVVLASLARHWWEGH